MNSTVNQTPETIRANLIAAKALIDKPEKWVQGKFSDSNGCLCAYGAIERVAGKETLATSIAISKIVPKNFVDGESLWSPVIQFNDHPDTTHADIMALFDRAIAAQVLS